MSTLHFEAKLFTIGSWTILKLPKNESLKLPSRGQTMAKGTINNYQFLAALEPDGNGSHWLNVDESIQKSTGFQAGDKVVVAMESTNDWPEPDVPTDLMTALETHKQAHSLWTAITPMARWEWIRWISSTKQPETRKRRIEVACSKLKAGERRPCCFNRNLCCVPDVSKNGILLEPTNAKA